MSNIQTHYLTSIKVGVYFSERKFVICTAVFRGKKNFVGCLTWIVDILSMNLRKLEDTFVSIDVIVIQIIKQFSRNFLSFKFPFFLRRMSNTIFIVLRERS